MKIRKHVSILAFCVLAMFIVTIVGGIVSEFALIPFLNWVKGFPGYSVPELERVVAWLKLSVFTGIFGGVVCWYSVKDRF